MQRVARPREIYYPESDGKPMGETDLHRWWMIHIYDVLKWRYRDQQVYVGSDLLLYYVAGDPKKFVVPDDFVVLDCDPGKRRTFQIWSEQRVPNVVIEVTSRKTKRHDQLVKPSVYAQIGVRELFLYDPTLDYLMTPLQGFRLDHDQYLPIKGNSTGALECQELGIHLCLDRERLVMQDAGTGQTLLSEAESARKERDDLERNIELMQARAEVAEARADALQSKAEAITARAEAAELRAKLAELENERLNEQLRKHSGDR